MWRGAAAAVECDIPLSQAAWLKEHRHQLRAALIPLDIHQVLLRLEDARRSKFLKRFHELLGDRTAELLRRRELLTDKAE